jgi:hypothetical protein
MTDQDITERRRKALSRRQILAGGSAAIAYGLTGCAQYLPVEKGVPSDRTSGKLIHVKPEGGPTNSGAETNPLGSIARATDFADPGDVVYVHPGTYVETVEISDGGTAETPLTLTGPPEAVLKPPEGHKSACLSIDDSHVHLTGLTIDGLHNPVEPQNPDSYHPDKLISINSDADGPDTYLEGLVVSPHRIGNASQSLINSVQFKNSIIGGFKVTGPAGARWLFDDTDGHNGEIIYLGTAIDNRVDRGYDEYDRTRNIRVHHIDNSAGHPHAEFVDCKEGTSNITVEYCTDAGGIQSDDSPFSTAINLEGFNCTVRWNIFQNAEGSGVEIGPWGTLSNPGYMGKPETEIDRRMGTGHAIYGNVFTGNALGGIDFHRESTVPTRETNPGPDDQRLMCDNFVDAYSDGNPEKECTSEHPSTDGVGHLGGESPWDGRPATAADVFARDANAQNLVVNVETTTATVNETMQIPVSVSNNGDDTAEVELLLRVGDFVFNTHRLTVPAGKTRETMFSEGAPNKPSELSLLRNGQKIAAIEVR